MGPPSRAARLEVDGHYVATLHWSDAGLMVKQRHVGVLGAALRRSHGFSAEPKVLRLSSRVRRAASSLQMQSEETVLDSYGPTKTAILTML